MATVLDAIQKTLKEELLPNVEDKRVKMDPIFPKIKSTSMNVVRNRGIGRGLKVIKTYTGSMAGAARFNDPFGDTVQTTANHWVNYAANGATSGSFPSLSESVMPNFYTAEVTLIEQRGNVFLPHQMLRADQLDASIVEVVKLVLQGVGELAAHQEAALFYANVASGLSGGDGKDALATITTAATACTLSADDLTLTITFQESTVTAAGPATGRVQRFRQGMAVSVANPGTGALRLLGGAGEYIMIADSVDTLSNTVKFRLPSGTGFDDNDGTANKPDNIADGDVIVLAGKTADTNASGVNPAGLYSWIGNGTDVLYGGLDLAKYPQHKSYIKAISAALTESHLNKHFGKFYEAFPGKAVDTAITTMGVLLGFIDSLDGYSSGNANAGRMRYDRNGDPLEVEAGFEGFNYRFQSRKCEILTSTYMEPGDFVAIKTRDGNIKRYVPPSLPGAGSNGMIGGELEFIAPIGGSGGLKGIFTHTRNSDGGLTDWAEAPWVRQWNIMPDDLNSMRLHTITEVLGVE